MFRQYKHSTALLQTGTETLHLLLTHLNSKHIYVVVSYVLHAAPTTDGSANSKQRNKAHRPVSIST